MLGSATAPVDIARGYLRRRRRRDLILLGAGLALLLFGVIGFTIAGTRSDDLAANGVRATATAVAVDPYRHAFQFDEHVDVQFRVAGGRAVVARCYTSAAEQFVVGQSIAVVYDPADPTRAQLAHDPDLGPIGVPLIAGIALGAILALIGGISLRHHRGIDPALPVRPMTATWSKVTAHRLRRYQMVLRPTETDASPWTLLVRGHVRRFTSAQVEVFGRATPRAPLVIVDPETAAVAVGRLPSD